MKGLSFATVLLFCFWATRLCFSHQWPTNIKRCPANTTDLNKCLMKAAKAAMQLLAKGNKALGTKAIEPLRLGNKTISSEGRPVTVHFQISNGVLEGLSKINIKNMSYDPRRRELTMEGLHKKLMLRGGYQAVGNLFSLNFNSKGKFAFENRDVQTVHFVKLEPGERTGYMDMTLTSRVMDIGRLRMNFMQSSLPPPASKAIGKMVNDHWYEVAQAVMPSFEDVLSEMLEKAVRPIFRRFPMKTLFPGMP